MWQNGGSQSPLLGKDYVSVVELSMPKVPDSISS